MDISPYLGYIRMYFPPSEWERANCITLKENGAQDPAAIGEEGLIDCGQGAVQARSWGLFQILDACWNPELNPNSPFTAAQWALVTDPNVNVWMASIIWKRSGWNAWTTCSYCDCCNLPYDEPIPHPEGPVPPTVIPPEIVKPAGAGVAVFGLGALVVGLMLLPIGK